VKKYQAIVFDLFSTVALWRPDRLPLFEWRGKTSHSTLGSLREFVETEVAEASFETFVDALADANEELAERRAQEFKEFPSIDRFQLALRKSGYADSAQTQTLAERLSNRHMELLAAAVEIPDAHIALLTRLFAVYPLALVSNFDHGTTARVILERDDAARFFDPVVISDEHGWRKPHPKIFADTLAILGVRAAHALYIGDSIEDDIVGAKNAGLAMAWINPRGTALPASGPRPDYEVRALPDLAHVLL
jgi:putative hydrolase of the HAD superfamily